MREPTLRDQAPRGRAVWRRAPGARHTPRVIKVGGRVLADPRLPAALMAAWRAAPRALCIVHGGGDDVSALQRRLGHAPPVFHDGRRSTTAADVEVVRMALSATANKRLVAALVTEGVPALGCSGEDAGLLTARPLDAARYGRVGTPCGVHTALLRHLLRGGYLPVIAPLARDAADAGGLNVNADDAAAAIAAALGATELMLLSDVPGVRAGREVVPVLEPAPARALIHRGAASDGMVAKLEAGLAALAAGVPRVRIGDLGMLLDGAHGTALVASAGCAT